MTKIQLVSIHNVVIIIIFKNVYNSSVTLLAGDFGIGNNLMLCLQFRFWSTSINYVSSVKNVVFWDVAPCESCEKRCFGGTCRLHLQGRKIKTHTAPHPRRRHSS
jgi:hypothetical protein